MATLSFKTYNNLRPSGMKVYAGAFILMADTTEEDFRELAELGITHTGGDRSGQCQPCPQHQAHDRLGP